MSHDPRAQRILYTNTTVEAGLTLTATEQPFTYAPTIRPKDAIALGRELVFQFRGVYSTPLSIIGTVEARIKIGGVTVLTLSVDNLVASEADNVWQAEARLKVTATGASGKVKPWGYATFLSALGPRGAKRSSGAEIPLDFTQEAMDVTVTGKATGLQANVVVAIEQFSIFVAGA